MSDLKKIQLATTETISSNYAGEVAERFFSNALLQAGSIMGGAVSVMSGFKYKMNLPSINLSSIVADATCDFTDAGTITRAERVLTLEEFEVNLQLCKKNYAVTFDNFQRSHGGLAPSFSDYLLALVAANVAASRETTIWSGATATAGEFDGFEVLYTNLAAQPAAQELAGTTVTATNVVAQIASVIDATPSAIYQRDDFFIAIPTNIYKHYAQEQAALGAYDAFNERRAGLTFLGVPLVHCPGMTDDVMFATYRDNLWYGLGSAGDDQRVDLIDMSGIDGSDNVRIVMKWADGVQVANPADVVTYGITNTGN